MDRDPEGAPLLEERHAISILLFLRDGGPSKKTDIYSKVSTNPRMPDKLDMLEGAGLIVQIQDASTRRVTVSLTPAGEEVASMLAEISRIVSGICPKG